MNPRTGILSFMGVAIVLLLINTPIMANSQGPGVPFKGYPSKGYYNHGVYTLHRYYANGHWYDNLLLNETD